MQLDRVQDRFLREAGISEIEGLLHFNLAPLCVRRDIAILGLIHRTMLGQGPGHFRRFFEFHERRDVHATRLASIRHNLQVVERYPLHQHELFARSPLGATRVYNVLPGWVVAATSVSKFQHHLQTIVRARAAGDRPDWKTSLSWRRSLAGHPLIQDHMSERPNL